ncbi:uncharacterized protein Ecym_6399 [Eremothecium cymbalariae DBVPG|uniref:FAR-17a/AIG1-like protein n=1 Tax=Eremothecium cymbalariae (strain CBS 270.75 / DBVPG 7215 / KCTC 17166 / NRRL Y-17582) TaxID=931890 RepID=G8JUJ3_ERECY|nr:hypothetical protein Ecym_6399 [Eremothecium cymbalariae DBVPG\
MTKTASQVSSVDDTNSKMSLLSLFLNSSSLIFTSWGVYKATNVVLPPNLQLAGPKQFLTIIGAYITLVNNGIQVLNLLFSTEGSTVDNIAREGTLPITLVIESIVSSVYWPLRLFFIHMILHGVEPDGEPNLSIQADLCVHLFPVVSLLMDYFLVKQEPFQMSKGVAWLIITAFGFSYNRWLKYIVAKDLGQAYPYPFLDVPEPYLSIIFLAVTTISWGFYCLYIWIHPSPDAAALKGNKKL